MNKTIPKKNMVLWKDLNWKLIQKKVFRLQTRIYKASNRKDYAAMRHLQKTLIRSWYAKLLAVRRVTQDNQGKKTAGIDGIKSLTPKQRFKLANDLKLDGKCKKARRVWIPKPDGTKRGLAIPTIKDRALQALVKMALEPQWEAHFEPNSYGFRPARSCHDAIQQIYLELKNSPKWVLDADIAKCFDNINHQVLLDKLKTSPKMRKQIKAWLKSGILDNGINVKSVKGTPQGGVISPLLANIALHGMEYEINKVVKNKNGKPCNSYYKQPHLIRYADDLVILHKEKEVILKSKEILAKWLNKIGLELKPSKTRICHSYHDDNTEKAGFDFLGFNIRHYQRGKNKSMKYKGKPLGMTLTIKPSKAKIREHSLKLLEVIRSHKSAPQSALIGKLNPIIRGWSNYYKTVCSKETFSHCDYLIWNKLRAWAKRRHPNWKVTKVMKKYWKTIGKDNWTFTTREEKGAYVLTKHADTPIKRFSKVQNTKSPYNGNWVYWTQRMSKHPTTSTRVSNLLKRQEGKCNHCNTYFTSEDLIEIDHIQPKIKKGKDTYDNLQLLHRHCHDIKTAKDME